MNFRFYIDPETGAPHIYRHGVTEDEATEVIGNPGEDRSGREGARVAIGQTGLGGICESSMFPNQVMLL